MTHPSIPEFSVIVVTWNNKDFIGRCLASIECATRDLQAEIFVVDNGSVDGTPDLIASEFPKIKLIRNTENMGFGRANNVAMRLARGKYLCLINSDVIATPNCLEEMACFLDAHPDIGLLGPKMLMRDGAVGVACMRRPTLRIWLVHALGLRSIFKNTTLHISNLDADVIQDVDILNGWFWMARKSAVDRVGLLDERFFIYGEDIEWCHRFRDQGWRVVYFPKAEATHYVSASAARAPVRFYVEQQRANLQYWKMYHGRISRVAFVLILILHQVVRIAGFCAASLFQRSGRLARSQKIERSSACLAWVCGLSRKQPVSDAPASKV